MLLLHIDTDFVWSLYNVLWLLCIDINTNIYSGNVMNGPIGKQMVDTLVESSSNVEVRSINSTMIIWTIPKFTDIITMKGAPPFVCIHVKNILCDILHVILALLMELSWSINHPYKVCCVKDGITSLVNRQIVLKEWLLGNRISFHRYTFQVRFLDFSSIYLWLIVYYDLVKK